MASDIFRFKQSLKWDDGGITASNARNTTQLQPIVLSLDLTPEQKSVITRFTGKSVLKLDMTVSDLQIVHLSGGINQGKF